MYLHRAGDRGRLAVALPAELNVALEVVLELRGEDLALNAERGGRGRVRNDQLDLAEEAAR